MADSPSTLSFTDSRNDVDAVYGSVPIEPEKRDVRLLQLQPGSYNDPIVCSLRVVSLLDHPEYQALSYCWEDPTDRKPITVNSNKFFVTSALECALRNIRDKNIQKLLWVDAICINLQDVREKNHQVRHMMKIFRFADIVLIWLGGKTNDSELAMKMLDDLASLYHLRQYWVRKNRHGLQALRKLLSRPYWHRRWVVEEIAASTKLPMVGCGNKWLSWSVFVNAQKAMEEFKHRKLTSALGDSTMPDFAIVNMFEQIRTQYQGGGIAKLIELLVGLNEFHTTDPRDQVFSVLGLAKLKGPVCPADYSKDLRQVYIDTTKFLLTSSTGPDRIRVLSVIFDYFQRPKELGLPSWVYGFSHDIDKRPPMLLHTDDFAAGGGVEPRYTVEPGSETLTIAGLEFDTVEDVISDIWDVEDATHGRLADTPVIQASTLTRKARAKEIAIEDVRCLLDRTTPLWRVLIMDRGVNLEGPPPPRFKWMFDTLVGRSRASWWFKRLIKGILYGYDGRPYVRNYNVAMRGRSFFATSAGFVGVGPSMLRKGDMIAILYGSPLPMALRSEDDHHILVGPSYVPGIMEGEAIELFAQSARDGKCVGLEEKNFVLH